MKFEEDDKMKKMKITMNMKENGLTLIEVVASIVILSIVLLSFAGMFLQSTKHTKYNKEKLTSVEVAEDVVADLRFVNNLDELEGYTKIDDYTYEIIYSNHNVKIVVSDGPADLNLSKVVITVVTDSETATKKSSFTTEMYINNEEVAS